MVFADPDPAAAVLLSEERHDRPDRMRFGIGARRVEIDMPGEPFEVAPGRERSASPRRVLPRPACPWRSTRTAACSPTRRLRHRPRRCPDRTSRNVCRTRAAASRSSDASGHRGPARRDRSSSRSDRARGQGRPSPAARRAPRPPAPRRARRQGRSPALFPPAFRGSRRRGARSHPRRKIARAGRPAHGLRDRPARRGTPPCRPRSASRGCGSPSAVRVARFDRAHGGK